MGNELWVLVMNMYGGLDIRIWSDWSHRLNFLRTWNGPPLLLLLISTNRKVGSAGALSVTLCSKDTHDHGVVYILIVPIREYYTCMNCTLVPLEFENASWFNEIGIPCFSAFVLNSEKKFPPPIYATYSHLLFIFYKYRPTLFFDLLL